MFALAVRYCEWLRNYDQEHARQGRNQFQFTVDNCFRFDPQQVAGFVVFNGYCMAVILSSHHNRQQVIALEDLMQEKDELDVEWRNLVLEQRALTEHNRIETLVEKQLDMYRPTADDEVVVRLK